MKLAFCILLCISAATTCKAGANEAYAAALIPTQLKEGADAVVRSSSMKIDILSCSEVRILQSYSITILNEKGKRYADMAEAYDKLNEVTGIKGKLFDAEGNEISRIRKSDIKDMGASGSNFADDNHYKFYRFNYAIYPFTVEYDVERIVHHTFYIPGWHPMQSYNTAIEKATLQVTCAAPMSLRFKAVKLAQPHLKTDGMWTILTDSVTQLKATRQPPAMSPESEMSIPEMMLALDDFELDGKKGSMRNWADFGSFFYKLNAGRQELPDTKKQDVHRLTDTCSSVRSKVALLYSYLQQETRYVSIQLGIGGWQTVDAATVAKRGYGDCKALSNYMMALLAEADIESHMVLVNAGKANSGTVLGDFARNSFNHVILFVPLANDSIWIECTSKNQKAGYLSSFTDSREVLEIAASGGIVRKTPTNSHETNTLTRKIIAQEQNNSFTYQVSERHSGVWWEQELEMLEESDEAKRHFLNRKYRLPTYAVDSFQITSTGTQIPSIQEYVKISGTGTLNKTANLLPARYEILRSPLGSLEMWSRSLPFEIPENCKIDDTFIIRITGAFKFEKLPAKTKMENAFGSFSIETHKIDDGTVEITKSVTLNKGVYPAEAYQQYGKICTELAATKNDVLLSRTQ